MLSPESRVALLAVPLALLAGAVAPAAEPAEVEKYEVKFFLDPAKVLATDRTFRKEVAHFFGADKAPLTVEMQFLDSRELNLFKAGWIVRQRKRQDRKDVELDYKRRFPIPNSVEAALKEAASAGFGAKADRYEVEVEWGLDRRLLTFGRSKELPVSRLPEAADARAAAVKELPDKLRNADVQSGAAHVLKDAHVFGTVRGWRWAGKHAGVDDDMDLELWHVRGKEKDTTERVVVVSFKKKKPDAAEKGRGTLRQLLKEKGWLLEQGISMTQLVLERYR